MPGVAHKPKINSRVKHQTHSINSRGKHRTAVCLDEDKLACSWCRPWSSSAQPLRMCPEGTRWAQGTPESGTFAGLDVRGQSHLVWSSPH